MRHQSGRAFTLVEVFIVLAILALLLSLVAGSRSSATVTGDRLTHTVSRLEATYPEPTGWVVDQARLLSDQTKAEVEGIATGLDRQGGAQLAVVTVDSMAPETSEASYAIKLAEKWGIGHTGKDDGVLFLIVKKERKVRIEVGRGLEGCLTDAQAGEILDKVVVPYLRSNDWDGGVRAGVQAILTKVGGMK